MQTVVDFFTPPPEVILFIGLGIGGLVFLITLAARAAVRAATPENAKKVAVEAGKIAAKTAGKAAWRTFKGRMGM